MYKPQLQHGRGSIQEFESYVQLHYLVIRVTSRSRHGNLNRVEANAGRVTPRLAVEVVAIFACVDVS